MLAWLLLGLGGVLSTVGLVGDVGFNFSLFGITIHLALVTIGLGLMVLAVSAALRFLEETFGIFIYTILIVLMTAAGVVAIIWTHLANLLLPRLGVSAAPNGGGSYSYGTSGSVTYPGGSNSSLVGSQGQPSGYPAWPNDPLGVQAWVNNNPGTVSLVLMILGVSALVLVGVLFVLSRTGHSVVPDFE